jgi:cytochrome P450
VILTGGSDTTSTAAAHTMVAFANDATERHRLQESSDAVYDTAVEEMLRWATPVIDFRRTATVDTEIAGQKIAAGDNVLIFYQSANRDERVFEDPYRFDTGRDPNPHVTFGGGGPHFCLGAALARLELKTFFRELFELLPDIEVAGDPVYLSGPCLDSVESLPCSFSPTKVE